jgi:Flp pilus assembly protein TadD
MTAIVERGAALNEAERLVASGAIRRGLGLESADLRFGLDLARNQLQRGATTEAFRTYIALVLCDPSDAEFQIGLANCALMVGENELALQAASAAIALQPTNPRGFYLSGHACMALRQFTEAREDLADAVELGRKARDSLVVAEADKLLAKLRALEK